MMSIGKSILFIYKKSDELEKYALQFERDEFIEICTCKRNIKRKNILKAMKNAEKSIQLSKKSKIYVDVSQRLRRFTNMVLNFYMNHVETEDLPRAVSNIEKSLNAMNFDLLELQLDTFEQTYNIGEDRTQELPYITMYKQVPKSEISALITQLAEEVKEEEKSFLFKKPDFVQKDAFKENKLSLLEKHESANRICKEVKEEKKNSSFMKPESLQNVFEVVEGQVKPFVFKKPDAAQNVSEAGKEEKISFMFKKPDSDGNV
uniref:Uncharacterized protein n=1 Tax=Graphocephala atropunctata TaxID=36148 RepID=A0A1B6MDA8_9HEMI